jgi:hypothetical protein
MGLFRPVAGQLYKLFFLFKNDYQKVILKTYNLWFCQVILPPNNCHLFRALKQNLGSHRLNDDREWKELWRDGWQHKTQTDINSKDKMLSHDTINASVLQQTVWTSTGKSAQWSVNILEVINAYTFFLWTCFFPNFIGKVYPYFLVKFKN